MEINISISSNRKKLDPKAMADFLRLPVLRKTSPELESRIALNRINTHTRTHTYTHTHTHTHTQFYRKTSYRFTHLSRSFIIYC